MLLAICFSTFATPQGVADPRPFVPPLATCHNYGVCPSRTAACIGLPYIPTCDPAVDGATAGPAWNLTLQEAINTAMANSEAIRNLGLVEAASRNDIVRSVITSYDPMEADALAASEWGIFDPLWTTELLWDKQDIPPGTSFSGIGNRPPQLDTADAYTSLEQLLPIGTRVRADLVTNYLFNPAKPVGLSPNPQYFTYEQFGVTQPLLRGFGVDVTMAPIKIAAAEAERTDWQFKQEMLALVRSIETTYWGLYAQQQNLKAIEQALPHFREVVRLRQEQAGGAVGTESEVARAQSDMYLFEQRRLDTLSKVAEQQLVLRNLMGLPPDDCRDIVLLAVPVTTRPFESLQSAVDTAVNSRPDVLRQRLAVYVASQERLLADNALKPQLDLNGFYRINGLGEELDESWDNKDSNNFDSWHMGVFFQIPLGRRQGYAELRAAEYRIARERAMLQQTAHQASYEVADAYRRINWVYQQLQIAANRQQALNQWSQGAKAQFESPPPGMTTVFALELYLQNLRDMTDASISANALLADYNSALARLEEVKGTLLENRMVEVAGDASGNLPSQLPTPEMQMPESVLPAPAAQPTIPAPNPAEPQGALPAPPATERVEIAREPEAQPMPLPVIEQPPSITPTPNAYADLPGAGLGDEPARLPSADLEHEPARMPEAPPVEVAEQPQIVPQPLATPSMEMPPSVLPEPAYTAMRPAPAERPQAGLEDEPARLPAEAAPIVEEPVFEEPMVAEPVAEAPAIQQPFAEPPVIQQPLAQQEIAQQPAAQSIDPAPMVEAPIAAAPIEQPPSIEQPPVIEEPAIVLPPMEMAREMPRYDAPLQSEASLAMPQSVLPAPAAPIVKPRVVKPERAPVEQPQSIARPIEVVRQAPARSQPLPQGVIQMPASVQASPHQIGILHETPEPEIQSLPVASLQLPSSVRTSQAEAQLKTPGAYAFGSPMDRAYGSGAPMQFPESIRSGSPMDRAYGSGAPMQFPESIRSGSSPGALPPTATDARSRQGARPLPPPQQSMKQAPPKQAGPQLQLPSSVRPAAAEGRVREDASRQAAPVQQAAGLQFPRSVGTAGR